MNPPPPASLPPPLPLFLDDNLIREILSWLPAETLLKFRCVCKSWKSLISDPSFAKLHLHRSYSKNADFSHIRLMISGSSCSVSSLLEQKVLYQHRLSRNYGFIGTCNGLFSLLDTRIRGGKGYEYKVRLWNPTTRSLSQESPLLYAERGDHYDFGFGYDSASDTYKVMAVGNQMVKVHNMGGDCWRSVQSFPPSWRREYGVYVKGTLNWIGSPQKNSFHINSFDLAEEKCSQLLLPYDYDYKKHGEPFLVVLKDCLCVYHEFQVTIWQMKKFGVHESWTQLLKITNIHLNVVPLCMSQHDDVLLLSKPKEILFLWNHRENITECFQTPTCYSRDDVKTYIGSLVSPC